MRTMILAGALITIASPSVAANLDMTPSQARDVTALIQSAGFNCPLAKLAYGKGHDAYGTVMQVYCGPKDREGVYEKAVFRITGRPDGRYMIKPWGD